MIKLNDMAIGYKVDFKSSISEPCESCIMGKQTRTPFIKRELTRADQLLQLIHSDLCGPMQTPSLGKAVYFLTFTDDFSRFTHIYFLKHKYEVFDYIKKYKNEVENLKNKKRKYLRTDNGLEFINRKIKELLDDSGIIHQRTCIYTPEQNGLAERKNRTIIEKAKSMMAAANMTNKFWAEAAGTAVYLMNRSPTKVLTNSTPYEEWNGRPPNLSYLKVFGCVVMAQIPKEQRRKLDYNSSKDIFLGYSDITKGYRIFDTKTNKVKISRNVILFENKKFFLKNCQTITILK